MLKFFDFFRGMYMKEVVELAAEKKNYSKNPVFF